MSGNIVNFVANGRSGANIENQLKTYANALRSAAREWDSNYDGTACHFDGRYYVLKSGGNPTNSPVDNTVDWQILDAPENYYSQGTWAELLASSSTLFEVNSEADELRNGLYYLFDGSYIKIYPSLPSHKYLEQEDGSLLTMPVSLYTWEQNVWAEDVWVQGE